MRIIRGLRNLKRPIRASAVTIGVFDGVHVGHREIIGKVVARARDKNIEAVVVTFDPHPSSVLSQSKNVASLISLDHRLDLFRRLGVDTTVVINFAKPFANMSPESFVRKILIGRLGARFIYTGENFYFGNSASAGSVDLNRIASPYGVKVVLVSPVKVSGEVVSSSLIREYITSGELNKAKRLLGRGVSILGTVVRGARFARVLGYPTANINPHHEVIPPTGVYAVKVRIGRVVRGGVLNIGKRPTFYAPRDEEPDIEAHIFDFKTRIYGKEIEIYFVQKIRDERRFKDAGALVRQIKKDTGLALQIMNSMIP
ncbi:MAG: bifunctional riboflavin kinase/FAD synthetase [Candidatus Omnitrophica bacterium]|nr:bifunctional riboflavin kinase/FAD synthetase [Candidatus Omnitrophota bacterium]